VRPFYWALKRLGLTVLPGLAALMGPDQEPGGSEFPVRLPVPAYSQTECRNACRAGSELLDDCLGCLARGIFGIQIPLATSPGPSGPVATQKRSRRGTNIAVPIIGPMACCRCDDTGKPGRKPGPVGRLREAANCGSLASPFYVVVIDVPAVGALRVRAAGAVSLPPQQTVSTACQLR
jgi:hypothetical protein